MFRKFFNASLPVVKAQDEEDLVDPLTAIKEKCSLDSKVQKMHEKLIACNDRVNSRSKTSETCLEEMVDYIHALDHCVLSKDLWSKLK